MQPLRCFIVSVDFADLLDLTLAHNRQHFEEIHIITSHADVETRAVCHKYNATAFSTDAFYDDGADFNKWKALELGLDAFGRYGVICLMDVDVLWPKQIPDFDIEKGKLYTPYRRMYNPIKFPLPPEDQWPKYPRHRNIAEWAGYSQIFHADDPHLGDAPWHEVNWKHAGGADSFFQRKWPKSHKVRPEFEVLHLGAAGQNWAGRATPYLDGTRPEEFARRQSKVLNYMRSRRRGANDPYEHERVGAKK